MRSPYLTKMRWASPTRSQTIACWPPGEVMEPDRAIILESLLRRCRLKVAPGQMEQTPNCDSRCIPEVVLVCASALRGGLFISSR